MAIHLMNGKPSDGKSVEMHKLKIHTELSQLVGSHVTVNFHTGEAGLYINFNGFLQFREGSFSVNVAHKEHDRPLEYGGATFSPSRVESIRPTSYGPVINLH
jgi:hypothetical protein